MTAAVKPKTIHAKRRQLALAAGTWQPFVDPAPAMRHIAALRSRHMALAAIAAASGVAVSTVTRLAYPTTTAAPHTWGIRPATERALLAVTTADTPDGALIDATGTRRRLEALAALGWSGGALAMMEGVTPQAVYHWRTNSYVTGRNARRVAALYDRLSMTPGRSAVSRRRAVARGWLPPLAWDDATIDDPRARPARPRVTDDTRVDDVIVARVLAGRACDTTIAERAVIVPVLAARGMTDAEIAELLGVWPETVLRIRHRVGAESRWAA